MTALKILHVISVDKENYYLNNLADHSDRGEVEHSFVTFAAESCDFVRDMKARGRNVWGLDTMNRGRYLHAYRMLGKLYKEEDPDIVHTHLFDPSVIGLAVAKHQKRKTVLTRHHSDAIHEIASPAKRRFYLALENYISRRSDHIIAPSRMVRDVLVECEGIAKEKVTVIPYGQTTQRFDAVTPQKVEAVRAELGMSDSLALVCVSRLFHRKGHKYLFQALSEIKGQGPGVKLYLVGDGEYRIVLENMAAGLGIHEDVRFLGWRDDALAIMKAADIIVHPSLEDALSSAVIESLMLERPIVATDISGVRDSLDDGKYGRIVGPGNSAAFRDGLQDTIQNLDLARNKAKQGRQFILDYMDARRVSEQYEMIYKKAAQRPT